MAQKRDGLDELSEIWGVGGEIGYLPLLGFSLLRAFRWIAAGVFAGVALSIMRSQGPLFGNWIFQTLGVLILVLLLALIEAVLFAELLWYERKLDLEGEIR